ncbi:BnaCnng21750D [Brassica napus]|uniref:BnaCnng21750D protein n=1 Tax=Brassica napus TaxID=3708 RepID=A0A078IRL5_BRANA|nr:BnaCnng21750D [Brassica napus]
MGSVCCVAVKDRKLPPPCNSSGLDSTIDLKFDATGSHYPSSEGDWSFNTFSEPVAFSQRERWSFDSQHFGGSSSVVVAAADSPCQSITKDVNTVWWWIVSAMFQKMEPSCSSKAPSKSFLIWRSISSKWSKPSSKDSVSKKRFWSRHRYNRSSSSIEGLNQTSQL